ncbi:MAG: PAS domain S-box protein, partial [candidate division Zixibacteria bacterium]|nr:PAS domain S-box protein [candidate division Zixibacteria bacterium]
MSDRQNANPFEPLLHLLSTLLKPVRATSGRGTGNWREEIFNVCLAAAAILGVVAYVPSVVQSIRAGDWGAVFFSSLIYGLIIVLMIFRRIPFAYRAATVTMALYCDGIFYLALYGPFRPGLFWLFVVPICAGLFMGVRAAIAALVLNLLTVAGLVVFVDSVQPAWAATPGFTFDLWLVQNADFIMLNITVAVLISAAVKRLESSLESETEVRASLEREVEDRRRAEMSAQQSGERFKQLFEEAPVGYILVDIHGSFVDSNRAAENIVGFKRDLVIGKSALNAPFVPASERAKLAALLLDSRQGHPVEPIEAELRHSDGTPVLVEISSACLPLGR